MPSIRLKVVADRLAYFRKMVARPDEPLEPGAIVDVLDREGKPLGAGFYNPRSEIALRMLGAIEPDFVEKRLAAAREFRAALKIGSNAYRVCHSEGDGLPGLVVDRFGPVHAVELFSAGFFRVIDRVRAALGGTVIVRADEKIQSLEGFRLPAEKAPEGVVIEEHGVSFRIDFERGHKTGFFCDQRENRRAVAELASGRTVLDLCTYTGGFAVHAARAGALKVVAVDMDEEALETARQNARLNRVKIDFLHADLFNYLRQSREKFDIVVLDPPKMAREREELSKARRAYRDMNLLAAKAVAPGGVLVSCSCSGLVGVEEFEGIVRDAAREAGRELRTFRFAGAGPDHPVSSLYPEGRYLKVLFSRVL